MMTTNVLKQSGQNLIVKPSQITTICNLKMDTLLLDNAFEHFRRNSYSNYGLDPAMYLMMPSFSWDACLKMTKVKLQLGPNHGPRGSFDV